jgi:hypothetical protein
MNRIRTITFTLSVLSLFSPVAYGSNTSRDDTSGVFHNAFRRQVDAESPVKITGNLICKMAETNNQEACKLKIQDDQTGTLYDLVEADAAMRLFQSGLKRVAVEGRRLDENRIQVLQAKAQ